ncbi:MAG: hypothetical protein KBD50_00780 [Candidatus Pacebacteria bacterium]|nr:hypothetical protein [Candidatus Paceibacterota bacterium]
MKNIITGTLSLVITAVAVTILVTSPVVNAADYSSGGSYSDYSYSGSTGSTGGSYSDYSYSGGGSTYASGSYSDYSYGNNGGIQNGGSSYTASKPKPASCVLKLDKKTVEYGGSVTITWKTTNSKADTANLSGWGDVPKNEGKYAFNVSRTDENLTKDKTYTLTVKGDDGKTVTCKETVKVKKQETPKAPECTIALSTYSVGYNGSVKVTWTSKNSDTVTLNGNSVAKSGSQTFSNLKHDTTYTIKAKTGSTEVTCVKTVEVAEQPVEHAPECDLSLSDYTVEKGDDVTVTWSTDNADTVKLNGTAVSKDSSKEFTNLQSDKTFTLEAWNGSKKVTCTETVEVETPSNSDAPECDLSLSEYDINKGDDVTVYWSTENADVVKLNGSTVSKDSSKEFTNIKADKEFKLEVWNSDDEKVTCTEEVTVDEEDEDDSEDLWCNIDASKSSIRRGESVRIEWESENAEDGYINNGIGSVDEEGSETVYPDRTTTYSGTFYGEDNNDDIRCSVTVYVDEVPTYIPPYVTLSSVPYTGLEMGPVATAIYWSFLVLWTLVAAYLIAVKKVHYAIARRLKSFLFGSNESDVASAQVVDMASLTEIVRAIVDGPAAHKPILHTTAHNVTTDATDEFVLSQIHRGGHGHNSH